MIPAAYQRRNHLRPPDQPVLPAETGWHSPIEAHLLFDIPFDRIDVVVLPVDYNALPGLGLACAAGAAGGTMPAVFNAAKEECVAAFLGGGLPFLGIIDTVERVMKRARSDCQRRPPRRPRSLPTGWAGIWRVRAAW
jgi:hypothetical protein